jgi:hypothetical protein
MNMVIKLEGSLKGGEILGQLDDSQLVKRDLDWTWNYFSDQNCY